MVVELVALYFKDVGLGILTAVQLAAEELGEGESGIVT